jgi:hypothetical protein
MSSDQVQGIMGSNRVAIGLCWKDKPLLEKSHSYAVLLMLRLLAGP